MDSREQIKKLESEVEELRTMFLSLTNPASVSADVAKALGLRLGVPTSSSKGATSENQAVNEAGASAYSVLKPPDAFLSIVISGTIYYVPVYT